MQNEHEPIQQLYVMKRRHCGVQMRDAKTFHYKCSVWAMTMPSRISKKLDLYPTLDQRVMKATNVDSNVKVGYWASKNHVQEQSLHHCEMNVWFKFCE